MSITQGALCRGMARMPLGFTTKAPARMISPDQTIVRGVGMTASRTSPQTKYHGQAAGPPQASAIRARPRYRTIVLGRVRRNNSSTSRIVAAPNTPRSTDNVPAMPLLEHDDVTVEI